MKLKNLPAAILIAELNNQIKIPECFKRTFDILIHIRMTMEKIRYE